jgi:hypothetical protein
MAAGVSAIVVCATAGEAPTLSPAEQEFIIRAAVDIARGRGLLGDMRPGFSFFRRTSAELCAAMARRHEKDDVVLNQYLAEIDDTRLHRALAAAFDVPQPMADLARKRVRPDRVLWRGLPSRANPQP